MYFSTPLIRARLVKRYKRFLADMVLEDGRHITAHCANPGAMTGLTVPGTVCWVSKSNNKKRKLSYSWELIKLGEHLVGVSTLHANQIIGDALAKQKIEPLGKIAHVTPEVSYGQQSRIDFLLDYVDSTRTYLEVKSVTLSRYQGLAEFPDSVTQRGAKHLRELAKIAQDGHRAAVLYLVLRNDCQYFKTAQDIDKHYHQASLNAVDAGVEFYCYDCQLSTSDIKLGKRLDILSQELDK